MASSALTVGSAGAPRRVIDQTLWRQLSSIDIRLLEVLAYLSRLTARRSPTGASYCIPGRAWLATRLGCSRETISEHVARLARLGLIHRQQRRPVDGRWQTNLYRLIHPGAWVAARCLHVVLATARRMPRMARLAFSPRREETDVRSKESLREVIQRGLAKWGPRPTT